MATYEEIIEESLQTFKKMGPEDIGEGAVFFFPEEQLHKLEHEIEREFGIDFKELFEAYQPLSSQFAGLQKLLILSGSPPMQVAMDMIHSSLMIGSVVGARIQLEKSKEL